MRTSTRDEWWRHDTLPLGRDEAVSPSAQDIRKQGGAPFWALMGFTFVLLVSPQSFIPALAPLHMALVAAAAAGFMYVSSMLFRRDGSAAFTREMRIATCLLGWVLLTLPFSLWPGGSLGFLLGIYAKALVIFWLLGSVVNTEKRLRTVAWVLSLLAVPLALTGVLSFFSGGFLAEELSRGFNRIEGYDAPLTQNPNDLALMLNLILPLTIALILDSRSAGMKCLLIGIASLDAIAIVATYSRAGFLTLAVVCSIYLMFMLKNRRGTAMLLAGLMLMSIPLLPQSYLHRLDTITDIQADATNSAQTRLADSLAATDYVMGHPVVGAGIGQDILALNQARGLTWTKVHDAYLEYAVDLGLPGLALFLWLFVSVIRSARDACRMAQQQPRLSGLSYLAQGIYVSLLGFTVAAFFYPDAYEFYFYYVAGLAVAARQIAIAEVGHHSLGQPSTAGTA